MKRVISGFIVLVMVTACGAATSSSPTDAPAAAPTTAGVDRQDPNAVHAAWLAALQDGDLPAAERLVDAGAPDSALVVQDAVRRMQDYLHNPASPTGALQQVAVTPVASDSGASVWQFANKRWCYRTTLIQRDTAWAVQAFGQTSVCP